MGVSLHGRGSVAEFVTHQGFNLVAAFWKGDFYLYRAERIAFVTQ